MMNMASAERLVHKAPANSRQLVLPRTPPRPQMPTELPTLTMRIRFATRRLAVSTSRLHAHMCVDLNSLHRNPHDTHSQPRALPVG
jgi:hypothetical protein